MLRVARRVSRGTPSDVLSLPYDERKKSRLRVRSERGQELAITLERGSTLRDGDLLAADGGEIVLVRAAMEEVSEAVSADVLLLTRAAYHLGNRHVPLQILLGGLRYQRDHVLDGMVRELGLEVMQRTAAFEPEGGAYAHGHAGSGDGVNEHESGHGHGHGHGHVQKSEHAAREHEPRAHDHGHVEKSEHAAREHEPRAHDHGHVQKSEHAAREHEPRAHDHGRGPHTHAARSHEPMAAPDASAAPRDSGRSRAAESGEHSDPAVGGSLGVERARVRILPPGGSDR